MSTCVLFIQGGGKGAHAEDTFLADSLKRALGPDYDVRYPRMPGESNPGVELLGAGDLFGTIEDLGESRKILDATWRPKIGEGIFERVKYSTLVKISDSMKLSKKSMNSALARRSTARTSLLTSVLNTIGRPLPASAPMRAMHSSAFSVLSTKGTVTWSNSTPSNCVSRLCPSICAVMPVPSETKNTVRRSLMDDKILWQCE